MTRRVRHLFLVGGIGVGLIICVQLIYPYSTALPFARALGQDVGSKTVNELSATFQQQFESSKVEFHTGSHVAVRRLSVMGATVNGERMAKKLVDYQWWQRLLPLSLIWLRPSVDTFDITMDGTQVATQSDALARELTYAATSASIAMKGDELDVINAEAGHSVTSLDVKHAIATSTYGGSTTRLVVAGTEVKPERLDRDISKAKGVATGALSRDLIIKVGDRGSYAPDKATRAAWLSVAMSGIDTTVSANHEAISQYVQALNMNLKTDPAPIRVTIVDGVETGRTAGSSGASLNTEALTNWLAEALIDSSKPATTAVQLQPVAPPTEYLRTYSHSQAGLRAYVAYATTTQNVRIVVQQLDGTGWSASGRASESIPSASTYKLYVMLRVFDDINSGSLNWNASILDTTAGGCFERTIVPSTNPCAEEWIRQYGRNQLNDYVHAKGFSGGTGFNFSDATHTTAGDLATYLIGLYNGTLVSGNNRDLLLEKMGRQLYRYGIPTGTKGWTQDKVGFLWDYIHDAAIVHNPKGTYVMVIMTKGYSYGYIANVARQIDTILYE
ncbi:MAG: serine hydrolase [Candidatus Saccharimonas sp.]